MDTEKLLADLRKCYFLVKDSNNADKELFVSFLKTTDDYLKLLFKTAEKTPAGKRWLSGQIERKAAIRTFYNKDLQEIKKQFNTLFDIYSKQDIDKFCKKLLLELEKLIQSGKSRYI